MNDLDYMIIGIFIGITVILGEEAYAKWLDRSGR
jgi:hypothetical protein